MSAVGEKPSDVILLVGGQRVPVQSSVLAAESRFFRKMFEDLSQVGRGPNFDQQLEVPLTNSVGRDAAEKLIAHIHGDYTIQTVDDAVALLNLADLYDMPRVLEVCEASLCLLTEGINPAVHKRDLNYVASLLHLADRLQLRHLRHRCKVLLAHGLAQLAADGNLNAIRSAIRIIVDAGVTSACVLESCLSVMWCLSAPGDEGLSCAHCRAYQGFCNRCGNICRLGAQGRMPSVEKVRGVLHLLDAQERDLP